MYFLALCPFNRKGFLFLIKNALKVFFYDILIYFYRIGLGVASPFVAKAAKMLKGRSDLWERIDQLSKEERRRTVLFHCASVGEFEQARPLIESFRETHPLFRIVLTFFSPSGFEAVGNYQSADYIFYLPFDTRENARRFAVAIDPEIAIVVKYEFWYHMFTALQGNGAKILLVSAIFRPDQLFFKPYGSLHRTILSKVHHFYVQNEESRQLLQNLGFYNASISGDTRFDRVLELAEKESTISKIAQFKGAHDLMVIGSSWPEDMDLLSPIILDADISMKYIIAPHEISESGLTKLMHQLNNACCRYSSWDGSNPEQCKVLIIDSIGLLSRLYRYGTIAYVGGAFGAGLHNILEAAVYGLPVFFGKSRGNRKFQEAMDLIRLGGAFDIRNSNELRSKILVLLNDGQLRAGITAINKNYLKEGSGATTRIMDGIKKLTS